MRTRGSSSAAFTLVELLVVIGIIGVLVAMLLPALARARASANMTACKANMQQLANATRMYANDNHDHYPDDWTIGLCIYRRGYLEVTPGDPAAKPEIYGLPALYWMNGYIRSVNVWICPSAMEKFKAYKNTYVWTLMTRTTSAQASKPKSHWTSRTRADEKNRLQYWIQENLVNMPPTTGFNYSFTSQPVDPDMKNQVFPHSYRTKITSNSTGSRRGAMNIVYMDGSIGIYVTTPSGSDQLHE